MGKIVKVYRFLIYLLPAVLFFSYYPLIKLGESGSMNFELSLPIVWLGVFDLVALAILLKKKLLKGIFKKWQWLLFPGFLTLSVFWSLNFLRGVLTVGILWAIYFAWYAFYSLKSQFSEMGVREKFWKVFFCSSLFVCLWCFLQCILDIIGVGREATLMCAGCVYQMFGFPHPNGFAIEPQFMGNLLLAPTIISGWILVGSNCNSTFRGRGSSLPFAFGNSRPKGRASRGSDPSSLGRDLRKPLKVLLTVAPFFIFTVTLFLTFSRGAIYAFLIAMIFVTVAQVVRTKKWHSMILWPVILISFLFTLNIQGLMAEFSKTDDTYVTGVTKVLNHLSLGAIDISGGEDESEVEDEASAELYIDEEISRGATKEAEEEAVFDGYVEESTDTRIRLNESAINVWKKDIKTILFGVGLGGAGQALYENGLSPAPKEIIQNEYVSLLLESGIVGISLLVFTAVLVIRVVLKSKFMIMNFALIIAYGISLMFFSGLPNALQVYLLAGLFVVL